MRNLDGASREVVVRADRTYRLTVGPGGRATRLIPGQPAGNYAVLVQGRRRGALVFGGEPGPSPTDWPASQAVRYAAANPRPTKKERTCPRPTAQHATERADFQATSDPGCSSAPTAASRTS